MGIEITKYDFITALKFVAHCMPTNHERERYNSVNIRARRDGSLILQATDGHRVARVELDIFEGYDFDIIVKAESVKNVLSIFKAKDKIYSRIYITSIGGNSSICDDKETVTLNCINQDYYDVDRIIPKGEPTGCPRIGFNTEYMASAFSALKPLSHPKYHGVSIESWDAMEPVKLTAPTDHGGFKHITKPAIVIISPMRL